MRLQDPDTTIKIDVVLVTLFRNSTAVEANLALVALERVRDGSLPALAEFRAFGGCSSGGDCPMCGHAIPQSKMEIEVEFGSNPRVETLIMHVECYYAWFGALRGAEVSR